MFFWSPFIRGEVVGSVGVSSMDEGIMDRGGAALVTGGAGAPALAASTTSANSSIQPDIELEDRGVGYNSVEDAGKG